jgi:hypothetical protein
MTALNSAGQTVLSPEGILVVLAAFVIIGVITAALSCMEQRQQEREAYQAWQDAYRQTYDTTSQRCQAVLIEASRIGQAYAANGDVQAALDAYRPVLRAAKALRRELAMNRRHPVLGSEDVRQLRDSFDPAIEEIAALRASLWRTQPVTTLNLVPTLINERRYVS